MAVVTRARVVLGGASVPKLHSPKDAGYGGRYPGIVEEAWWTLKAGRPLYVAGGFGGAAALVVEALESERTPSGLDEARWQGSPEWDKLVARLGADPALRVLGLPKNQAEIADGIHRMGASLLSSDGASLDWNGLTLAENRTLFRTRDVLTLAALVLKGLIGVSTRAAKGKLQIELVEGDVTEAVGLDVVAFPAFSDLGLDGAGAALDRASGGAATRARQTDSAVSSGTRSFGASYVLAANLGPTSSALKNIASRVRKAASAAALQLRRYGFKRVGIVTFLGNVADNLSEVVDAMVSGLHQAADTSEIVWFEQDPVRAAIVANTLAKNENVVLTRRAPAVPQAPTAVPGRARTVIAIKRGEDDLDVSLLLHRANGMVPVAQPLFSESDRVALAGKSSDRAPAASVLAARGQRIAEILFGERSPRVLTAVGESEVVVMHDVAAGGIPYEAMGWDVDGERVTPATHKGIVRHLLVSGVTVERALTRPVRGGKLGVLVVIDPTQNLAGAREEGEALVLKLQANSFNVRSLRGSEGTATVEKVLEAISIQRSMCSTTVGTRSLEGLASTTAAWCARTGNSLWRNYRRAVPCLGSPSSTPARAGASAEARPSFVSRRLSQSGSFAPE